MQHRKQPLVTVKMHRADGHECPAAAQRQKEPVVHQHRAIVDDVLAQLPTNFKLRDEYVDGNVKTPKTRAHNGLIYPVFQTPVPPIDIEL